MDLSTLCLKTGTDWQITCAQQIIKPFDKIFLGFGIMLFIFFAIQISLIALTTKKKGIGFYFGVLSLDIFMFMAYLVLLNYLPNIIINLGVIG